MHSIGSGNVIDAIEVVAGVIVVGGDGSGLLMFGKEDSVTLRSEETVSEDVIEVEGGGCASCGDGLLGLC